MQAYTLPSLNSSSSVSSSEPSQSLPRPVSAPAHPSCSPQSHTFLPSRRCCNPVVCPCPLCGFLLCRSSNPDSGLPGCRTSKWHASHRVLLRLISPGKTDHVSQICHSPHGCIYRSVCHRCCLDHYFCLSSLHRLIKLRGHFLSN